MKQNNIKQDGWGDGGLAAHNPGQHSPGAGWGWRISSSKSGKIKGLPDQNILKTVLAAVLMPNGVRTPRTSKVMFSRRSEFTSLVKNYLMKNV